MQHVKIMTNSRYHDKNGNNLICKKKIVKPLAQYAFQLTPNSKEKNKVSSTQYPPKKNKTLAVNIIINHG